MELGQIHSRAQVDGTRVGDLTSAAVDGAGGAMMVVGEETSGIMESKSNGTGVGGAMRLVDRCLNEYEDDEDEDDEEDEDESDEDEEEEEVEEDDVMRNIAAVRDGQSDMTARMGKYGIEVEEELEIIVAGGGGCFDGSESNGRAGEPNKRLKLARNGSITSSSGHARSKSARFNAFNGSRASPSLGQIDDHHCGISSSSNNNSNNHNYRSASAASYGSTNSQASSLSPSVVAPSQPPLAAYLQFLPGASEQQQQQTVASKSETQVGGQQEAACEFAIMSPQEEQHPQQASPAELQSGSQSLNCKYQIATSIWHQQQQQTSGTTATLPQQTRRQTPDLLQNQAHNLNHQQQLLTHKSTGAGLQSTANQRRQNEEQQLNQHRIIQLHKRHQEGPQQQQPSAAARIHNGHSQTNGRFGHNNNNNINRCDSDNSAPPFNLSPSEQRENDAKERVAVQFGAEVEDPSPMIATTASAAGISEHEMMIGQRISPAQAAAAAAVASQAQLIASRLSASNDPADGGHHHRHQQNPQQLQQQQELAALATKLKTPRQTSSSPSASFMTNHQAAEAAAISTVSSTTSSSSVSSSSSSSASNCSASSLWNLSNGYPSSSMFGRPQQQQQQKNNEQQKHQRTPTNNLSATNSGNQSIETENHKLLEQQHQFQQPQQQQQQQQQPLQRQYPPNHPLGNTKHLCSICGDRATGKHYGVYSCEGCKGFFKRTIRKDIVYVCRADGDCLIDMRQRNRCQYCRYQKCLRQGMKREAVQEEKQRLKLRACAAGAINCDNQAESTSNLMIGHTFNTNNSNTNYVSQNNNINNLSSSSSSNNHHHTYDYISSQQHKQRTPENSTNQIHLSEIVEAQLNVCDRNNDQQHHSTSANHHQPQHYDLLQQQQQQQQQNNFQQINSNNTLNNNQHNQIDISPSPSLTPNSSTTNHYLSPYHHHHYHNHQSTLNASNRLPVMRDYNNYYNATNNESLTTNNTDDYHHHHQQPPRKYSRIGDLTLKWAAQLQIEQLLDWAKSVPNFTELLVDDQLTLLKAYWNELIISDIAFKSIDALKENQNTTSGSQRSLCIGKELFINKSQAYEIGLSNMFDRIIDELVVKMHDMHMDSNELACLRAIILFNPETQGLKSSQPIEEYRGDVYTALELYCRKTYDDQPNRFGKLLLRLPALRSIGLKCDSMRRCDSNNNNLQLINESSSANSLGGGGAQQQATAGGNSPSGSTTMLGYQVKLLFFDICYEASAIDSFLRSNLMHR